MLLSGNRATRTIWYTCFLGRICTTSRSCTAWHRGQKYIEIYSSFTTSLPGIHLHRDLGRRAVRRANGFFLSLMNNWADERILSLSTPPILPPLRRLPFPPSRPKATWRFRRPHFAPEEEGIVVIGAVFIEERFLLHGLIFVLVFPRLYRRYFQISWGRGGFP